MIEPSAIPSVAGDPGLLRNNANEMGARGERVGVLGSVVDSTWRGLGESYRAPEAAALLHATGPARAQASSTAGMIRSVVTALLLFAAEAGPVQSRLRALHVQADDFVSSVAGRDWQADTDLVREHNHLMAHVDDAVAAWDDAQRRCANAINAVACGRQYRADDGDNTHSADEFGYTAAQLDHAAVDGGGVPWGTSERRHHPWSANQYVNDARIAIGIGAGLGHAAIGLSGMVNVFRPKQLLAQWGNAAKLAIALNSTFAGDDDSGSWLFKPGEMTQTRTGFASSLVDAEDWKNDPAKALGENIFTVLSSVPTGGIGAGVKGLSKAGELSRVADAADVGSEATVAGRLAHDSGDLVSPARQSHIDQGEPPDKGGHIYPGQPGKTLFPRDWTKERVMHEISDIATDPDLEWVQQGGRPGADYTRRGKPVRFGVVGTRGGVRIQVVVEPSGEGIITGYPLR